MERRAILDTPEPPILMPKLFNDLSIGGVQFVIGKLKPGDLAHLPQPIIVNCTGLGARELVPDPKMRALQVQIVHLPAQQDINYLVTVTSFLVTTAWSSEERRTGLTTTRVNDATCIKIVKDAKDLFAGKRFRFLTRARWLIRGK